MHNQMKITFVQNTHNCCSFFDISTALLLHIGLKIKSYLTTLEKTFASICIGFEIIGQEAVNDYRPLQHDGLDPS